MIYSRKWCSYSRTRVGWNVIFLSEICNQSDCNSSEIYISKGYDKNFNFSTQLFKLAKLIWKFEIFQKFFKNRIKCFFLHFFQKYNEVYYGYLNPKWSLTRSFHQYSSFQSFLKKCHFSCFFHNLKIFFLKNSFLKRM